MGRFAYVNGRYLRHAEAGVSIDDRGYQFADSVYEVCEVKGGALVDERRHVDRLERSLAALEIPMPMVRPALGIVMREVVRRNRVVDGIVYVQVSRGIAPRDHLPPLEPLAPALVVTAKSLDPAKGAKLAETGIAVVTRPDNRWDRVDIKTTGLLPNVLAKAEARRAGAREAWFVDRTGSVTEGASANAWIVTADGALVTRQADQDILAGITREVVLDLAARHGLRVEIRPFTVDEAHRAREAFVTSASQLVMPVVRIDEATIGNGMPGSIATSLRQAYHEAAEVGGRPAGR